MTQLLLRKPDTADESALRRIHEQLRDENFSFLLSEGSWDEVLASIEREAAGHHLPPGRVPADFLVAEVENTPVGRVSIRYRLNDYLLNFGGHIGFAVGPEFRGRGYATEILRQSIARLNSRDIYNALVVCEVTNSASSRVIEKCGGKFEDARVIDGTEMLRYWISSER